ncbi:MAG: MerR family transcriptional regulator [Clostridia bacterium]|nr:MerR family transcriptional regulator [Clostridia bacterium]
MIRYTTGEVAEICNVSVRTVQFYDKKDVVKPSWTSEGGRRLYSEEDLAKLKKVCFLRDLGFSLSMIVKIMSEGNSKEVISLIFDEYEKTLKAEIEKNRERLKVLGGIRGRGEQTDGVSLEKIESKVKKMEEKNLRKMRLKMLVLGVCMCIFEIGSILVWIFLHTPVAFIIVYSVAILFGVWLSVYYYKRVKYICPECRKDFKPTFKQMFFATHTLKTRKLVCPHCGKKSYCLEKYDEAY